MNAAIEVLNHQRFFKWDIAKVRIGNCYLVRIDFVEDEEPFEYMSFNAEISNPAEAACIAALEACGLNVQVD